MRKFLARSAGALALVSLLAVGSHSFVPEAAPATEKASFGYTYAGATQQGMTGVYDVAGYMDPEMPGGVASGEHSLVEMSAQQGTPSTLNAIEVGWTVDNTGVNGTDITHPHLFGYSWVNGVGKGYNASNPGWVDYTPNPINLGADLTSYIGTPKLFEIYNDPAGTGWWLYFDGQPLGHYAQTQWSSNVPPITFTTLPDFQAFGEVAANSGSCIDMGNGVLGSTTPTGARVSTVTFNNSVATNLVAKTNNAPTQYNGVVLASKKTTYLGGPGPC